MLTTGFRRAFTLRQHTPIIHFQHEQEGATLRAMAVKPQLDKYIWEELITKSDNDYARAFENYGHLLKGFRKENRSRFFREFVKPEGAYRSFDYQLRINTEDVKIAFFRNPYPCYFGNMGQNVPKFFSYTDKPVSIIFNSYQPELLALIEQYIVSFFSINNFGTRATKGFGSFTIDNELDTSYTYSFFKSSVRGGKPQEEGYRDLFEDIDIFYRTIRSGINSYTRINNQFVHLFYMKPLLWHYFKFKYHVSWEKKKIKEAFYEDVQHIHEEKYKNDYDFNNTPTGYKSNRYLAIKDLMGLSSSEEWRNPYNISIKKEVVTNEGIVIDRAASPLFFKPVLTGENRWNVHFHFKYSNLENSIVDSEVRINAGKKGRVILQTPESFDLQDLFDEIVHDDFNIDQFIVYNNDIRLRDFLMRIYDEIIRNR